MNTEFDAKVVFTRDHDEFKGQLRILLPGLAPQAPFIWEPGFFEFHSVLAASHWLNLPIIECVDRYRKDQNELIQSYHKVYMQSKYPGWPQNYVDKKFRRESAEPAELSTSNTLNAEDLGL